MKKFIAIVICASFLGCASNSWFSNPCVLKQAFSVAIRSLEGSPLAKDATKIPQALQKLADSWLPKGNQYSDFVKGIINEFVVAHPVTPAQVDKVLETLAVKVQSGC
jgi:hypothetical protein